MKNRGFNVDYVPPYPRMMALCFVIEQILIEKVFGFEGLRQKGVWVVYDAPKLFFKKDLVQVLKFLSLIP